MSMLASFPGFIPYALASIVLALNLLALWGASGAARGSAKSTPNKEDARAGTQLSEQDPPSVTRVLRAHSNAMANIVPFVIVALVYVLLGAPANLSWILFGTFAGARVMHSIVYTVGVQPWRSIFFAVGFLTTLTIVVQVLRIVVPAL